MVKRLTSILAITAILLGAELALAQTTPPNAATGAAPPAQAKSFDAYRGDRAVGWVGQSRSEVVAINGMAATSQSVAVEAGIEILRKGGNAFDAAVAVAAAINVVEPEAAGVGGDLFMIAWSAKDKKLIALDGSGRAATGATPERFRARGEKAVPFNGIDSAVIPGTVDAWDMLLKSKGTMTFREVLEPAARLAEQGFGVTERIASEWQGRTEFLRKDAESARVYLVNGVAPPLYSVFRNSDLARTFRTLQAEGRDAFYKGSIAQAIVAHSKKLGGTMTMADFGRIRAQWVEPISTRFKDYDVYEMPPSTQGFAVLQILNMLEVCPARLGIDPASLTPKSPDYWHLMVEAKKIAYDDLEEFNGDPDFSAVPVARLISKEYAAQACGRIDMGKAMMPKTAAEPVGGTAYITTADRQGNVVSLIFSIYGIFGSGITVPGHGFILNNRAADFSLDPKSPNVIAPGKRPFYTIIPGFVAKDGKPLLAFGLMSGDQQAQGHAQVVANMLMHGANPQAASDAARFSHNQRANRLTLESGLFDALGEALKARGHTVVRGNGGPMGGYQAIMLDPVSGVLRGASDHRKDGQAQGF